MRYTLEDIAAVVPDGADYVVYPINDMDWRIVNRYPSGNLERVGTLPVYLKDDLIDGMHNKSVSVWCMKEMRFVVGSEEQLAYRYIPPVREEPVRKDPKNEEKADRNWQIWRERKLTNKTLRQIGEEHGVGPERIREIVSKCNRMIRSRFFYNYHTDKITPQMMAAVKDMEFVYPADYGYHILLPDGRKDYLR
jgi:hypothetical protein